jgi:hypothetical protein
VAGETDLGLMPATLDDHVLGQADDAIAALRSPTTCGNTRVPDQ